MHTFLSLSALFALVTAALTAQAEATPRAGKPDPLDPKASVPALVYVSSLQPAKRAGDDKPISWREANDTVARIGGWRVYAREAAQADPAPAAPPVPAMPTPARAEPAAATRQPGHGGHKMP